MKLFESTSYNTEINKICSAGYKLDETKEMVFHPLQINIVMMPPGQDLPLHQVNSQNVNHGHVTAQSLSPNPPEFFRNFNFPGHKQDRLTGKLIHICHPYFSTKCFVLDEFSSNTV